MLTAQVLLEPYSQLIFPSTKFPHFATSDSYTYFESFTYFPFTQVQVVTVLVVTCIAKSFKVTQPMVSIVKEIPAYNYYTCRCALCTNGDIYLGQKFTSFTPEPFPLGSHTTLICPFWADADPRDGGDVYSRITEDSALLQRASHEGIQINLANQSWCTHVS